MLNALLIKEFRIQMRSRKYYSLTVLYVFIICIVAFAMFWSASTSIKPLNPEYGIRLSYIFFMVLTLAICVICPSFAVNLISTERQNLTFDILRSTILKRYQVISGKILLVIAYILFLMFLSLPVSLLIMPVSGEMGFCYMIVFLSATTFSIMGLAWSSIFKKMSTAVSMTYVTNGFFAVGIILIPIILDKVFQVKAAPIFSNLLNALNPFWVIFKCFTGSIWSIKVSVLPAWMILVLGYLFISAIAIVVSFMKLKW